MATSRNLPAARQSKPPASASSKSPTRARVINVNYNINNETNQGSYSGPSGGTGTGGGAGGRGPNWLNAARNTLGSPSRSSTPRHVPQWLGNDNIVAYAWLASMILVGFDEWKNHGILPRPIRLWDTSIVFGLLALMGMIDTVRPLANALAIGYMIVLLYSYYAHTGQFGSTE